MVLLNLSSLGTIWYHRYNFKRDTRQHERFERRAHLNARGGERRDHRSVQFLFGDLNLSEKQQQKFREIWEEHIERRKGIAQEMEANRRDMGEIMSFTEVDTIKYMELANRQADLILMMDKAMVDMNLEFRKVLSEDQLPLFLKKIEQLNQRRLGISKGEPRIRKQ